MIEKIKKNTKIIQGDSLEYLQHCAQENIALSFLDPPFNQGKEYRHFDDKQAGEIYWAWMESELDIIS